MNAARVRLIPFIKSRVPRGTIKRTLQAGIRAEVRITKAPLEHRIHRLQSTSLNKNEHSVRGGPSIIAFESHNAQRRALKTRYLPTYFTPFFSPPIYLLFAQYSIALHRREPTAPRRLKDFSPRSRT